MHSPAWLVVCWMAAAGSLAACGAGASEGPERSPARDVAPPRPVSGESAEPEEKKIVVLGDSITAGHGLPADEAFPALLQERIDREGYDFRVVNAGVSGDTTAGGLRRLDWVLEGDVRVLIVALGGNDGLRGLSVSEMKSNLETIIARAEERGIEVLLAGMEAPPNQGGPYTEAFREAFHELARERDVAFMPFLLQDVGGVGGLNQSDGIHPSREGARVIAENVWNHLEPILDRVAEKR